MATDQLNIGSPAPDFKDLRGTDGKRYSLKSFAGNKCLVVVFACNHCPYVQAYEDRMIALQREYGPKGVQLVGINANETANYPEDSFEHMVKRSTDQGFNFVYLRDDDQSVARKFGATHTPEFFLFDEARTLRYHGKMDDNYQNPGAVKSRYLQTAVEALLSGAPIKEQETYSIGCTIKWK
jgi:peroxiredoxin